MSICILNWQSPKTLRLSIMQDSHFEWIYDTRLCWPCVYSVPIYVLVARSTLQMFQNRNCDCTAVAFRNSISYYSIIINMAVQCTMYIRTMYKHKYYHFLNSEHKKISYYSKIWINENCEKQFTQKAICFKVKSFKSKWRRQIIILHQMILWFCRCHIYLTNSFIPSLLIAISEYVMDFCPPYVIVDAASVAHCHKSKWTNGENAWNVSLFVWF